MLRGPSIILKPTIVNNDDIDDDDHTMIVNNENIEDDDRIITVIHNDLASTPSHPTNPSDKITKITQTHTNN